MTAIVTDAQVFWWLPEPLSAAEAERWLRHEIATFAADGTGFCAVVLGATDEVIGSVALKRRELDGETVFEVGYHLGRRWWGHGYATEAAGVMVAEARERGLERVVAFIHPDNRRSQAVAGRLGMSCGQRILWAGLPHDVWEMRLAQGSSGPRPGSPCYDN